MELYHASNEWAQRPVDQRFWTLEEMTRKCLEYRQESRRAVVNYRDLEVETDGDNMFLTGKEGTPAKLNSWSFGQVVQRAGAPAGYLRTLNPHLAVECVNDGLYKRKERNDDQAQMLLQVNGGLVCRGFTGMQYERIWNHEVGERLMELPGNWRTPPALDPGIGGIPTKVATVEDCLPGLSQVQVGSRIAPSGIYASPHDLFVFLVNTEREIDTGLFRGVILWNSEVGAKSIGAMSFLFNSVCGNHIVWGASHVTEFRFRHVGSARARAFHRLAVDVRAYVDGSGDSERAKVQAAKSYVLGAKKDEILDALFKVNRSKGLSIPKATIVDAVDFAAEPAQVERYGNPRTVWAVSNAMSELSHKRESDGYADKRFGVDRAAGRLMEIAF